MLNLRNPIMVFELSATDKQALFETTLANEGAFWWKHDTETYYVQLFSEAFEQQIVNILRELDVASYQKHFYDNYYVTTYLRSVTDV